MVAFRNTDASGRTSGLLLRCILYSLLALGCIIFDKRYDHFGQLRRFLSVVAYPVQVAIASPFQGWDWFRESVSSRETLRADKARLEAELRLADFRLQRYEALEAESQRLRGLRANTAEVTKQFVVGDIMNLDLDAFRERVLVDKGARDGVFVGQAVLDAGGVFGQVARVGELTSEVILISDAAHAIPVQVNRNGLRTIAVGTGDTSRLKLPYLSTSADVVVGDLLVTSGLGGGFPVGYPVGTVAEVRRDPAQSLADVEVRPAAALDRSRELMFVWLPPGAATPPKLASGPAAVTLPPASLLAKPMAGSAAPANPAVTPASPVATPAGPAATPAALPGAGLAVGLAAAATHAEAQKSAATQKAGTPPKGGTTPKGGTPPKGGAAAKGSAPAKGGTPAKAGAPAKAGTAPQTGAASKPAAPPKANAASAPQRPTGNGQ